MKNSKKISVLLLSTAMVGGAVAQQLQQQPPQVQPPQAQPMQMQQQPTMPSTTPTPTPSTNMNMQTSSHVMFTPDAIQWTSAPIALPSGAQIAVLEGDPTKKGPFTIRLKFPANYQIPAHTHPGIERITVISGALHLGFGDKIDTTQGTTLSVGSFAAMQPGNKHYAWTDQETVIQLTGSGPWDIKYVNPSDDPRKKS